MPQKGQEQTSLVGQTFEQLRALGGIALPVYTEWQREAVCSSEDFELFFPQAGRHTVAYRRVREAAIAICKTCPVRLYCLGAAARGGEEFGIWGGLDEGEREYFDSEALAALAPDGRPVPIKFRAPKNAAAPPADPKPKRKSRKKSDS
jgi:WhiB family redox-sensing transcriptional regulator